MMPSFRQLATALSLAVAMTGPARAQPAIRDSAGVRIVTNTAPRSSQPLYRIDPMPLVDLGTAGAEDEFAPPVFSVRLHDGGIVVATGATELRFYDAKGKKLRSFGRKGGGPGEFQRIQFLGVMAGDTIVAFDAGTRRLTVVSPGGGLVRTLPLANPSRRLVAGLLPGGRILAGSMGAGGTDPKNGMMRDTTPYLVLGPRGDSVSAVGRFAGREAMIQVARANGRIRSMTISTIEFGRTGYLGVDDSVVVAAPADRFEILRYSQAGRLLVSMSRLFRPEAPTPADLEFLIDRQIRSLPPGQEAAADNVRRSMKATPLPKTKPPYDAMVVRSNGEIWVRDYLGPYSRDRAGRWSVFDRTGVWITTVETPAGLEPQVIGADFLLGYWLDSDDLPHVRLFRLTPAGRAQ